jgi:hypothetical protein
MNSANNALDDGALGLCPANLRQIFWMIGERIAHGAIDNAPKLAMLPTLPLDGRGTPDTRTRRELATRAKRMTAQCREVSHADHR